MPFPSPPPLSRKGRGEFNYLTAVTGDWLQVYGPKDVRYWVYAGPCRTTALVEEAMMTTGTREQMLERVAGLGALENVFLVAEDNDTFGLPIIWYPEIGLRYVVIENDDLAHAVYEYLRYEAKVRRFASERQVSEAMYKEKWEGWNTRDDYRRMQRAIKELAERKLAGFGARSVPE